MPTDAKESNAGHTPGPWIVIPGWGHEKDTLRVLHIDGTEANAHLIAAAPDLLAALKAMGTAWDSNDYAVRANAWNMASDAVTKSEGGAV